MCTVFKISPENFEPTLEVSGCFIEVDDRILLLRRHKDKAQGSTWGIPSGKHEIGENALEAMLREVKEEVALDLQEENVTEIGKFFMNYVGLDYVYHMFRVRYQKLPEITLGLGEHHEARWVTFEEALKLPLIAGGIEALNFYHEVKEKDCIE